MVWWWPFINTDFKGHLWGRSCGPFALLRVYTQSRVSILNRLWWLSLFSLNFPPHSGCLERLCILPSCQGVQDLRNRTGFFGGPSPSPFSKQQGKNSRGWFCTRRLPPPTAPGVAGACGIKNGARWQTKQSRATPRTAVFFTLGVPERAARRHSTHKDRSTLWVDKISVGE